MKKVLVFIAFLLAVSISSTTTYAAEKSAAPSAQLTQISLKNKQLDTRAKAVKRVFEKYDSPLSEVAYAYVKYADEYEIDWKLLPSISGLESSYGKFLMPDSYNAYGWGGGYIYFDSWEDGIETISKSLRKNYYDRGANTVEKIGPIYAESKTWVPRVNIIMKQFEEEYITIALSELEPTL